jgi:hypothetical protein
MASDPLNYLLPTDLPEAAVLDYVSELCCWLVVEISTSNARFNIGALLLLSDDPLPL